MASRDEAITASGLNILMALWLIASPYVLGFAGTSLASNFITVGILVGIVALVRVFSPESSGWLSWVNVVLGIWLIVSPFFTGVSTVSMFWNGIISGIIVAALALWSSSASRKIHA